MSSFSTASQLSSSVSISSASKSFCSGVSFSTHFALSNLGAAGAGVAASGLAEVVAVEIEVAVTVVDGALF